MNAFHSNWSRPFQQRHPGQAFEIEAPELFTTALSSLNWQKMGGSISMLCDKTASQYYTALGLSFLWNGGIRTPLDDIPPQINSDAFWAAGKLYALQEMRAPCVMIDTDFILWQPLPKNALALDAAAIHKEDIYPDIYPGPEALSKASFDLHSLDWTVRPLNTALTYFGNEAFKRYYTDAAISFMLSAPHADDPLIYMVFAEQRLLAMCAARYPARVEALSSLDQLFSGKQQAYTHIWGFKQQMRDEPLLLEDFCLRCAARLTRDFPQAADRLRQVPTLRAYFV